MSDDLALFSTADIKDIVQDMRNLLSQSSLAFLLGAGCSKSAGLPLMKQLSEEVFNKTFSDKTMQLLSNVRKSFSGAQSATIEDYMSEIVDLLSITERRTKCGASHPNVLLGDIERDATEIQTALDEIKQEISFAIGEKEVDVTTHQQFVRAIHGSLQAGKKGRCVDYFILNYDTLIEDALGLERVVYCDGFTGAATGWWEPDVFKSDGIDARIFKIHRSIDWCLLQDDPLPRRIRNKIKTESSKKHVLIYPAATKYQETQRDPFAQMLQYMRQSLCPGEGKEMVLVICGYSFGDSHINLEIENALKQSEGRLTIASFVENDKPEGKLREWSENTAFSDQIKIYTNKGFFHGNSKRELAKETPWWKFEVLSRLLGGER